jgi:hypothetical protein
LTQMRRQSRATSLPWSTDQTGKHNMNDNKRSGAVVTTRGAGLELARQQKGPHGTKPL